MCEYIYSSLVFFPLRKLYNVYSHCGFKTYNHELLLNSDLFLLLGELVEESCFPPLFLNLELSVLAAVIFPRLRVLCLSGLAGAAIALSSVNLKTT